MSLTSVITLQDGSSFKWEGSFINEGLYIPLLFGTNTTYIDIAEGLIRLRINGTDNFISDAAITENTTHTIELFKTGNDYSISFDGGTPVFMVTTVDDFFTIDIGKRSSTYGNTTINTLELNNETYHLNEANGYTFFSDGYDGEYKNKLVAANQDYLNAGTIDWVTWGDVSLDVGFGLDLDNIVDFSYPVSYFIDNSNRVSIFWGNNGFLRLQVVVSGLTIIDTIYTVTPQKENLLSIENGIVVWNGVTYDGSANVSQPFLNANTLPLSFGARLNTTWREFCNCSIYNFSINNEVFPLNEPDGAEFKGSLGTTGERKTTHADQLQYINEQMIAGNGWSKGYRRTSQDLNYVNCEMINRYTTDRERKVELVSANEDYLEFNSAITLSGDFSLSVDLDSNLIYNGQVVFGAYSIGTVSNIALFSTGKMYIRTNTDPYYLSGNGVLPSKGSFLLGIKRVGADTSVYVDNVLVTTTTLVGLGDLTFQGVGRHSSSYFDGAIKNFTINEQIFDLNEANGAPSYSRGYNGQRKNVFVSANQDHLEFDSHLLVSGDFTMSFDISNDLNANTQTLFSGGTSTNVALFGSGKIYWQTETDALYLSATGILPTTGVYVLGIERIGNDTMFYMNGGLVDTISGYNGDISLLNIGLRSTFYFEGIIRNFSINSETFSLNEASGAEFYGSNGTSGTRLTAHGDQLAYINSQMIKGDGWSEATKKTSSIYGDNYINHTMIKLAEQGETQYKNVLVAANEDYLNMNIPTSNGDVLKMAVSFPSSSFNGSYIVSNNDFTQRIYLSGTSGRVTAIGFSFDELLVDGVGLPTTTDLRGYPNALLILSFTVIAGEDIYSLFRRSTGVSYCSCTIYNFTLNGETFKLNENEGAAFTGSLGTTGTRVTTFGGGIEYINEHMIKEL